MSVDRAERIRELYQGFNDRDLDAVIAAMAPDVDWPNGMEGGRVLGRFVWTGLRPGFLETFRAVGVALPDGMFG